VRVLEIHEIHGNIGSATGFEAVSHGLKELGHDVYQFSLDSTNTVNENHIFFLKFQKKFIFQQIFSLRIAKALFSYIKRIKPEIIHFHAIDASLLGFGLPILYGKLKGAKVVKTQHDWGIICTNAWHVRNNEICDQTIGPHCQGCYIKKSLFLRDFFGKKLLRNLLFRLIVDMYTVPSRALLLDMQKFGYKNVQVIPNFLDKQVHKYPEHQNVGNQLIFIGRFVKEKGIEQLMAAMAIIRRQVPDTRLIIIGKGTPQETTHLEELIDSINGRDFIHIFEGVSDLEKMELLKKTKVCIMPSIWKEAFGLVILEAFASGVPVVAFKIGGIPEVIQDDRVLAEWMNVQELAEKTIHLLQDEKLRTDIIRKNALRMQDFDKEKIAQQWSMLFSALVMDHINCKNLNNLIPPSD
jgi:glycosyltransferase involved in cell wall biosynthesis